MRWARQTGGHATVPDAGDVSHGQERRRPTQVEGGVEVVRVFGDVRPGHADQAGGVPSTRRPGVPVAGLGERFGVRCLRGTAAGVAQALRARAAGLQIARRVCCRLRLDAGRMARVHSHVRQERPSDEAGVLF